MARRRRHRRSRSWLVLATMTATLIATVLIGMKATPIVVRYVFLNRLTSDDPALREQGLNYVLRHAGDPAVRSAVRRITADCDDELLAYIAGTMHKAGAWGPHIGRGWVRRFAEHLDDGDAGYRVGVAYNFADAASRGLPVRDDPLLAEAVTRLAADPEPFVRWYALRAAAALPAASADPIVDTLTTDTHPTIAAAAADIKAIRTSPNARVAFANAWPRFADHLSMIPAEQRERIKAWRAVLTESGDETSAADYLERYRSFESQTESQAESHDPAAAAIASLIADQLGPPTWSGRPGYTLRELAHFENLTPRSIEFESFDDLPDLVLVAALRAAKHVKPDDFMPALSSEHAGVRHLAVLLAIERFDRPTLDQLARDLSNTFYNERRISGALLIGLTGSPAAVLDERLAREHDWLVKQHLHTAQYMLGRNPNWASSAAEALLTRTDFPNETVHLALLHRGDPRALDYLFRPLALPGSDFDTTQHKWHTHNEQVRRLFDDQRFEPMLRRYLPDAPPFNPWADPEMQRFQVSLMRYWYLMHRAQLSFDNGRFVLNP